jgi:hypothetical protein
MTEGSYQIYKVQGFMFKVPSFMSDIKPNFSA